MARGLKELGHEASLRSDVNRYKPIIFGFLQLVLTAGFAFLVLITDPTTLFSGGYLLFTVLIPGLGVPAIIVWQHIKEKNTSLAVVLWGCGFSFATTCAHLYFISFVGLAI